MTSVLKRERSTVSTRTLSMSCFSLTQKFLPKMVWYQCKLGNCPGYSYFQINIFNKKYQCQSLPLKRLCCLLAHSCIQKYLVKIYQLDIRRRQWHPTPVLLPGKSHGQRSLVGCSPWGLEELRLSDFTFTFHFHALEKKMATHFSVLAWRIPGMGEPGGLPSMGSHRVRHD